MPTPSPHDDFGFEPEVEQPVRRRVAEAPPASDDAAAPSAAEAEEAERGRRRRRRGGRGRRRTPVVAGSPDIVDESSAPPSAAPVVEAVPEEAPADDFGLLPDAPEARVQTPAPEPVAQVDPVRRRDGRARHERLSRASPAAEAQEPPRRSSSNRPMGIQDWFSPERLDACQRAVGYYFRDVTLLENALTHSSIKSDDRPSYERLEFLGDSVIGLVIAGYLFDRRPHFDEGELTKIKSMVVSTDGLADAARKCGLDRFLAVGRGILMKDTVPKSLVADVFEGVVGAVYLDRGYEAVRLYVLDLLHPFIEDALSEGGAGGNFKSVLQQVAQRDFGDTPYYEVLREGGPEHSRVFEVFAVVGKHRFGVARAPTKREAEQAAAKLALQTILLDKSARKSAPRRRRSR